MATNQTQHYALNQWELSDSVVMAEFNADNQKLDTALAALDDRIDAAQATFEDRIATAEAAINAAKNTLNKRIDSVAASATQKVNAAAQTAADNLAAVQATIPQIQTGSYVGTGTYGADNPTTLTFDFQPKLVLMSGAPSNSNSYLMVIIRGQPVHRQPVTAGYHESTLQLTWGERSVSWYTSGEAAFYQYNVEGEVYHYIAIG